MVQALSEEVDRDGVEPENEAAATENRRIHGGNILHRHLRNRKDASRNDCLHLFMGDVQRVVLFHAREINGFIVDNGGLFTSFLYSELIVNIVHVDDQFVCCQGY